MLWYAAACKPWNDEAVAARAGFNLGDKRHTAVEFYEEKTSGFPGVNRHTYYIFPSQLPVLAVWCKLVGFSLFTTRMLSLLWTGGLLIAYFLATRRLMRDDNCPQLPTSADRRASAWGFGKSAPGQGAGAWVA